MQTIQSSIQPNADHQDATTIVPHAMRRYVVLLIVIALGLTLFGFLRGIQEPAPLTQPRAVISQQQTHYPAAVNYSDLPQSSLKANSGWTSNLSQLQFTKPGPFDPVIRTDEMKQAALQDRARNRAYDSAPPVIPHAID